MIFDMWQAMKNAKPGLTSRFNAGFRVFMVWAWRAHD